MSQGKQHRLGPRREPGGATGEALRCAGIRHRQWQDHGRVEVLAGGEARLKHRETPIEDEDTRRLKSVVADLATDKALLVEKIRHLEAGRPVGWWRSKRCVRDPPSSRTGSPASPASGRPRSTVSARRDRRSPLARGEARARRRGPMRASTLTAKTRPSNTVRLDNLMAGDVFMSSRRHLVVSRPQAHDAPRPRLEKWRSCFDTLSTNVDSALSG